MNEDHLSAAKVERVDELQIPITDSVIGATRYHPTDTVEPLPTVVIASPYRKDDRIIFGRWIDTAAYVAHHGYNVVPIDLPGTGASTGAKPHPFAAETEGTQVAEAIEAIADEPWSVDRIGMIGLSYGGWTQLAAAAQQPDPLAAIVPVAISDSFTEWVLHAGSFNALRYAVWATQMAAYDGLPPSYRDARGRWAEIWDERLNQVDEREPWLFAPLVHDDPDDEFWEHREIRIEDIEVPTMLAVGYRDIHALNVVEYFEQLTVPKRLLLGPWRHVMPHRGRESAVDFRRQAIEWFDRFLKDLDNPALNHDPIEFWTERDGGWKPNAGVWRGTDTWPVAAESAGLTFAMAPTGLIPEDDFTGDGVEEVYEFDHTVGVESLQRIGGYPTDGWDTTGDDARSIVFDTDPLQTPVELTGTGSAQLVISSTTPNPLITVRVNDVTPDGTAKPVTGQYGRPSHHDSKQNTNQDNAGTPHLVSLQLNPRSHVFETGHRVRVAVSAANFMRAMPPHQHGSLTLYSKPDCPSAILFPGLEHPSGITFPNTIEVNRPDEAVVPVGSPHVRDQETGYEFTRHPPDDSLTFHQADRFTLSLPHAAEMTFQHDIEAKTRADNPASFSMKNDVDIALDYGYENVRSSASSRVTLDGATLTLTVQADNQLVFEKTWRH